jgi:thioredoxin reductase (NADPH)
MKHYKVIVIGSGPAGLTSAIYTARANLKPLVVAGLTFGGQLMLTTEVENFPGFVHGIQGPELMQNMIQQAERFGAEMVYDDVTKIDLSKKPFVLEVGKESYTADSVIVASGASTLWLGLPSEEKFRGKGVSSCATCDGFFFKDREIIVVGGGDSAMEEASYLTKFASKVTIVHRRDKFRASKIMQDRVLANPKIAVMYNTTVEEFTGEEKLSGVKLKDVLSGETKDMAVEGAFIAIGHNPNTALFTGQIEVDEKGYVLKSNKDPHFPMATSVPGVFVAGDVHDHHYRQAITAAGMGCMAAIDAERYLGMDHG